MSMSAGGSVPGTPASPARSMSQVSGSATSSSVVSSVHEPEGNFRAVASLYRRQSTATDVHMRIIPPPAHAAAAGSFNNARATIIIPGWVRERAAEVLFEGGDVDERSIVELVLDTLLKAPVDLRRTLASTILVVGGTAMLPGFIPRLQAEIAKALSSSPQPRSCDHLALDTGREGAVTPTPSGAATPDHDVTTPTATRFSHQRQPQPDPSPKRQPPPYDPYAPIRSLTTHVAILNNPSPSSAEQSSPEARANAGKAPAFAPALMPWVGGSLAGALKIGSEEIVRERWDEAFERDQDAQREELDAIALAVMAQPESASPAKSPRKQRYHAPIAQPVGASIALEGGGGLRPPAFTLLPDWSRTPLSVGAPNVVWIPPVEQQEGVAVAGVTD
ncbi:hypothetical protein FRB99_007999 [Tulasnella sp. 403]|nr:hypothetical protein FRB99_007999 [Tulasnella sp. 403]